jgi:gamma-glutamyltranspeptidase/glutathione hydrolase
LRENGSAADAAIAAALTLAVADPAHSGIGGGGLAVYYDKMQNRYALFDYLESAPLSEVEGFVLPQALGEAKAPDDPVFSVAVPGLVAGLEKLHRRFGKLAWAELFTEALEAAENGFVPDETFRADFARAAETHVQAAFKTFFAPPQDEKQPLKQENLAQTLKKLRDGGAKEFYEGALSKVVLKELAEAGSRTTVNDFAYYEVRVTEPALYYDKDLKIAAPGWPSFGQAFLDRLQRALRVAKIKTTAPEFPKFLEDEAKRFVAEEAGLKDLSSLKYGYAAHVSVIDARGNAISLTDTLHGLFGSGTVLNGTGILLNAAGRNGYLVKALGDKASNLDWALKKRPVNFLTPMILTRGFEETSVLGTSGGITIPQALFQILEKAFDEQQGFAKALKAPLFYSLPREKQNLHDKGFSAKALAPKTAFPAELTPYPVGSPQIVQSTAGKIKAFSTVRDGSAVLNK